MNVLPSRQLPRCFSDIRGPRCLFMLVFLERALWNVSPCLGYLLALMGLLTVFLTSDPV